MPCDRARPHRQVLIDRLINRGLHWLAHEVCRYLRLENSKAKNRVLVHWARNLVLPLPYLCPAPATSHRLAFVI